MTTGAAAGYVADVSAIVHLSPREILWRLPLADGLLYQRERWLQMGVKLRRNRKQSASLAKYFQP